MVTDVCTIGLYPLGHFFYHGGMKKNRPLRRVMATALLALIASYAMSADSATSSFTSDLAADLYQRHHVDQTTFGQCLGGYASIDELQTASPDSIAPNNARVITVEMDRLTGQRDGLVQMQGNVIVVDQGRQLQAAEAELDVSQQNVLFPQGLLVQEGELILQGDQGQAGLDGRSLSLNAVQWVMPGQHLRGTGQSLDGSSQDKLQLNNATLTRCEPGNGGWLLSVDELEIDETKGYASAKGAVLRIKSVPVGYLPRMRVSLDGERTTGWQMPSGSLGSSDGLEVQVPYFWRVSPQLDATVAPRWISERGFGIDGNLGYVSDNQEAEVDVSYLPSDDLYNGLYDEDTYRLLGGAATLGAFEPADRWLVAVNHQGRLSELNTRVDFARTSDRDFFRDLDSYVGLTNPNALNQLVELSYRSDHLSVSLRSLGFQRLDELNLADYEVMPALSATYRSNPIHSGLGFSLAGHWSEFDRRLPSLGAADTTVFGLEGSRMHLVPALGYRQDYASGFWALDGGYQLTRYQFDSLPLALDGQSQGALAAELDAQKDREIPFFSAQGGLFFEREVSWQQRAFIQTLEPRVYYLKQGYERQDALPIYDSVPIILTFDELFLQNHFAGFDRIGDADRATFALTSRLISPAGREVLAISGAHLQHFKTPRVTLPGFADVGVSDLFAADVTLNAADDWQLRGRQLWNYDASLWEELGISLHMRGEGRSRYNLGFKRRRLEQIKQAEFSAYAPVNQHVALTARWHYDVEQHRTLEAFAGLEYDDCCTRVRLIARQYLENPSYRNFGLPPAMLPSNLLRTDRGVLLEVQLKGLAGFGSKVEALLRRGVYGYDSPTQRMSRY